MYAEGQKLAVAQRTDAQHQIPLTRFAYEHLKSGGTPRPVTRTHQLLQPLSEEKTLPKPVTPVVHPGMLNRNIHRWPFSSVD